MALSDEALARKREAGYIKRDGSPWVPTSRLWKEAYKIAEERGHIIELFTDEFGDEGAGIRSVEDEDGHRRQHMKCLACGQHITSVPGLDPCPANPPIANTIECAACKGAGQTLTADVPPRGKVWSGEMKWIECFHCKGAGEIDKDKTGPGIRDWDND